jgi:GAF domain-containing protein
MFVAVQQLDAQSEEQFRVVAAAVADAHSEHDILAAIASYAQRSGATDLGLMHINLDSSGEPGEAVFAASIGPRSNPAAMSAALPLDQLPMFLLDQDQPEAIVIFEDFQNDPRFDSAAKANSYTEIVWAVEGLRLTEGDVHLTLVRGDERSSDFYYEVVAASDNQFKVTGLCLERGSLPIFEQYESSNVYVMEDVQAHLLLDDINRARLAQLDIRFTAGYPLRPSERVLGALSLVDREPLYFSMKRTM